MRRIGKVAWAAGAGAVLTGAVLLFPALRFAYEGPQAHLALEVAQGVIGLGVSYLVWGRLRAGAGMPDVLLLAALVLSAATNLLLGALPALVSAGGVGQLDTWGAALLRTIGAVVLAIAPFTDARTVSEPVRAARVALGLVAALLVGVSALVGLAGEALPVPVAPDVSPLDSTGPLLVGHPLVLLLQSIITVAYVVAVVGYVRLGRRRRDEFVAWVAAAVTLGAFARVNYLLFPSLYTDWVYTGDVLRMAFWLTLLVGGAREVRTYWERLSHAAVAEERRRIARELHDGLAQELAFLVGQAATLRDAYDVDLHPLASAAERALYESRRAIAVLSGRGDHPLPVLLMRAAEEVCHRHGVRVRLAGEFPAQGQEREELVRIVREAVNNAVRHGRAEVVDLALGMTDEGRRLVIRDDGRGFDVEGLVPDATRFGLLSMRERVESLGGVLTLRSSPDEGTEVEVVLP